MATQEQIAANIEATRARRAAARERDLQAARERKAASQPRPRYPEYDGKLIGFVVHTKRGYKPFIGRVMDMAGEDDALIHVLGSQDAQETLDTALAFFAPDRDQFALVLEKPVPNGGMMGHWLASMLAAQDT